MTQSDRSTNVTPPTVPETPSKRDRRMAWWREARFGMFIHFGLYSIPAGQWHGTNTPGTASEWLIHDLKLDAAQYTRELRPQFNPTQFDADRWASLAKSAGMNYIVITTKHHEGFCLFDSRLTDNDVMAAPFRRDIMKELADAARRHGIRICWYHSILDWHHPDAQSPQTWPAYVRHLRGQLEELLTNYGPIGVLWFDGEWDEKWTEAQGRELYAWLRSRWPELIVNNRVGNTRAGFSGISQQGGAGDFYTPEQQVPEADPGGDWESCVTMNGSWGFKADDHNWKPAAELIRMLIDIASKNGNFLLNVGPTGTGEIPPPSVDRLVEIGRWMKVNGESIYGTRGAPPELRSLPWGRCTQKAGRIYLHVFDWPSTGELIVPLRMPVSRAYALANPDQALQCTPSPGGVRIALSREAPDPAATVLVLETAGEIGPS